MRKPDLKRNVKETRIKLKKRNMFMADAQGVVDLEKQSNTSETHQQNVNPRSMSATFRENSFNNDKHMTTFNKYKYVTIYPNC